MTFPYCTVQISTISKTPPASETEKDIVKAPTAVGNTPTQSMISVTINNKYVRKKETHTVLYCTSGSSTRVLCTVWNRGVNRIVGLNKNPAFNAV